MQVLLETGAVSNANMKNLQFKQNNNSLIELNQSVNKDIYTLMIFFFFTYTTWYS